MDVLLFGASGLTGSETLRLLLSDPDISSVTAPVRKQMDISHPKLMQKVIDFDKLDTYEHLFRGDAVIISLGTTMKQAGTEEKFRQVDLIYPLAIARLAHKNGIKKIAVISTIIANPSSRVLYIRTKGELEQGIQELPFEKIIILRPSFILGKRKEFRFKEAIINPIGFILPAKYRSIKASRISERIVKEIKKDDKGVKIFESKEI